MRTVYAIDTPLGRMHAEEEEGRVVALHLPGLPAPAPQGEPQTELKRELEEYFEGKRKAFDVPFSFEAPPFLQKVLKAAQEIPYGSTATYAELAAKAGSPKASRAAGRAMATNPLPILIPCHRAVYTHGKKQQYAGGPEMKDYLLELEKRHK